MGADSKIEWCDQTFNPWIGCTKVSPGCANCYAEGESKRRGWAQWGRGNLRHRTSAAYWKQPIKWNQESRNTGKRLKVFCASLADWLDDEVPIEWFIDLLSLIKETPNLDWLLLTKRPQNFYPRMQHMQSALDRFGGWISGDYPENVWLGVSVEDQQRADERIPLLLEIPARIRFLSCEPLLGPLDFQSAVGDREFVDWVIVGGESGPRARPCNIEWIADVTDQCQHAGAPVFVKQLGSDPRNDLGEWNGTLRDRKGGDPDEWPNDLNIREFPGEVRLVATTA